MSLQEFASLGAAMSGLGVMLGIIYFGIELHQNTRAVRVSALQQVINSFAGVSFDIARDRNLVDLFLRAGADYASLDDVERTQFSLMLRSYLATGRERAFPDRNPFAAQRSLVRNPQQHQIRPLDAGDAGLLERNPGPV